MRAMLFCGFPLVAILAFQSYTSHFWQSTYRQLCNEVSEKIYTELPELPQWHKHCLRDATFLSSHTNHTRFVDRMQWRMNQLPISHLDIYKPQQFKSQWKGESQSIGVEAKWIDGLLIITHVWPDSPAKTAGLRPGDQVLEIKGLPLDEFSLNTKGGELTIQRQKNKITVSVHPATFTRQEGIRTTALKNQTLWIRVPSFRPHFFDEKAIDDLNQKLASSQHVVLDLRGNGGGSFVAALRLLSLFYCEKTYIGKLDQPRKNGVSTTDFENDLSDQKQIQKLREFKSIRLNTFSNMGCFQKPLTLLIDHETASVSEVVTAGLQKRPCTKIAGSVTAGQVVLAIWYPLPILGPNYSISIPEAAYFTADQKNLEGQGISADHTLYYSEEIETQGRDSWLEAVMQKPPECNVETEVTAVKKSVTEETLESVSKWHTLRSTQWFEEDSWVRMIQL